MEDCLGIIQCLMTTETGLEVIQCPLTTEIVFLHVFVTSDQGLSSTLAPFPPLIMLLVFHFCLALIVQVSMLTIPPL